MAENVPKTRSFQNYPITTMSDREDKMEDRRPNGNNSNNNHNSTCATHAVRNETDDMMTENTSTNNITNNGTTTTKDTQKITCNTLQQTHSPSPSTLTQHPNTVKSPPNPRHVLASLTRPHTENME
jgi:hypothetical protein